MTDLNLIRSALTVTSLLLFVGLMAWAWSSQRRADFEAAAKLPFAGEMNGARDE